MIASLYSIVEYATGTNSSARLKLHDLGEWNTRVADAIVGDTARRDLDKSLDTENAEDRAAIRFQPLGHSGYAIAIADLENSPMTNYSEQFSQFYSYPMSVRHAMPQKVTQFTTPYSGDAKTTVELLPTVGDYVSNLQWLVNEVPVDLSQELAEVFSLAAGEHFEDGMETKFSLKIGQFIRAHRLLAISAFQRGVEQNRYRASHVAEALLWIGELDDDITEHARRNLLESACNSDYVSIRDAAVSGLSYLGAAESKYRLERMLKFERVKGVRANIKAVLAYLRD